MAEIKFENFATSTIANVGGIGAGDLSVDVQAGDGALFPSLTAGDWFYVVATKTTGAREIMMVTARSTDTLTITRAQDGTSALAFDADDPIELRVTAAVLERLRDYVGDTTSAEVALAADGIGVTIPRQKIVQIGDWNMDTTSTVSVAHGLTLSKILSVSGVFYNDAADKSYPIANTPYSDQYGHMGDVTISYIDATNIVLQRTQTLDSGYYDGNTDFNATSYNRGYLVIKYLT